MTQQIDLIFSFSFYSDPFGQIVLQYHNMPITRNYNMPIIKNYNLKINMINIEEYKKKIRQYYRKKLFLFH